MKALVYHGPGKRAWQEMPRPEIKDAADAIVRITTSTICGTDLHILKGDLPSVTAGRILGHEGIGIVEDVVDAGDDLLDSAHVSPPLNPDRNDVALTMRPVTRTRAARAASTRGS